jgi:hypothetical protein
MEIAFETSIAAIEERVRLFETRGERFSAEPTDIMNTESITLFPPTHEQSLPTFHVREDLRSRFIAFLEQEGFQVAEQPEHISGTGVAEILLEAGTPLEQLESAQARFLAQCDEN